MFHVKLEYVFVHMEIHIIVIIVHAYHSKINYSEKWYNFFYLLDIKLSYSISS